MSHTVNDITSEISLNKKLRWYLQLRWYYIAVISGVGILGQLIDLGYTAVTSSNVLTSLAAFATNGVFLFLARRFEKNKHITKLLSYSLVLLDTLIVTIILFIQGGIESRGVILYTLPILISGVLFGRKLTYLVTSLAAAAYIGLISLDYLGMITPIDIRSPDLHDDFAYYIASATFFPALFVICASVANYLTRLLWIEEKELMKKEKLLRHAQQIARLGSWSWDLTNNQILWSDQLYSIFGTSPGEYKPDFKSYLSYVLPEDRKKTEEVIENAAKTCEPFEFIHRIKSKGGESVKYILSRGEVITDRSGNAVSMRGTAQDITELQESQVALEQRSAELEKLNQLMIGRELRMAEIKKKLKENK